ncbi:MAG: T9SS type A sorting domain-containing protein [Chitinophagales bacterium]|nr:T9SS type A sorting domain-containing protein [Chitinophagaceae bacterium]MCB9063920.1 T9SS type A sorting domain-containing protein [Chitinophagales bacterium]
MNKLLPILTLLLSYTFGVVAQPNLVPNGDFETYIGTCQGGTVGNKCAGWGHFCSTPDYFNTCINVPNTGRGWQMPASGNAFVGILDFNSASNYGYREALTAMMTPMQIGVTYDVSFSVCIAERSYYFTNGLCVHFFDTGFITSNPVSASIASFTNAPPFTPKISFASQGLITDTANWVRLSAQFVADSAYDHIAIGGFLPASNLSYAATSFPNPISNYNYIFIDSVVVRVSKRIGITFNDTALCVGDTIVVPYYINFDTSYFQSNNVFKLQLSDSGGSFANPLVLDSVASNQNGTFITVIPSSVITGNKYRLRMISTNGQDTSYHTPYDIAIGDTIPSKPVAGNNGPVCSDDTLALYATCATAGVSYRWTGPNTFTSNFQVAKIGKPATSYTGSYIVTAYLGGCEAKDTTDATVIAGSGPGGVQASTNAPICVNDTLKLMASSLGSGITYTWTGPGSYTSAAKDTSIYPSTAEMSGDYYLVASNGSCVSRDTVTVTVKPNPDSLEATYNTPLCAGTSLNLSVTSSSTGVTYSWTGPNSFNSTSATPSIGSVSPVHNGDYIVIANLYGCSDTDTVHVTVDPGPVKPTLSATQVVCSGDSIKLYATSTTSGVTYSWTGPNGFGSTDRNPVIANSTTTMSGIYTATVSKDGCSKNDTISVLVKQSPSPVTVSTNSPLCDGDTLNINSTASSSGATYSWTGPTSFTASTQNTTRPNSSPSESGWYKLTVGLNGCTYKDSTYANIYLIPGVQSIGYTSPVCVDDTLKLNSTSTLLGATYSWIGPGSYNSSMQNPVRTKVTTSNAGKYYLTVTVNGCTSPVDSVQVLVNPQPFVVIVPSRDSICDGQQVNFTSFPNNHGGTPTYQWYLNAQLVSTGTTFSTTTLKQGDVVRCDMTEYTKCLNSFTDPSNDVSVTVMPWKAPSVSITANPTTPLKPYEYVTFTAVATDAGNPPLYQWKRNGADVIGAQGNTWAANTLNDNDRVHVEIKSTYLCPLPTAAASNDITVRILTSVGDVEDEHKLSLYPNPNNGTFVLSGKVDGREELYIDIINALGQKVYSTTVIPDKGTFRKEINLNNIANGTYLLRVQSSELIKTLQFRKW